MALCFLLNRGGINIWGTHCWKAERKKKEAWVAVVEVIEDNLPSRHLLVLVELFLCRRPARAWGCERGSKQIHPQCTVLPLPSLGAAGVWKVHFPGASLSSSSGHAPVVAHDISSRCGMWGAVLIFVLFLTFLNPLRDCRQYPRCSRGAFPVPYATSVPPHIGRPDSRPSLPGRSGGMLSSVLSRQGLEDTRPRASGAGCYV